MVKAGNKLKFARELEGRTEKFADNVLLLCKGVPKNTINIEIVKQLIRSSCSVGANYIEANESFSEKDFYHRIKICRKESKESCFWLRKLITANPNMEKEIKPLINEGQEFVLIFSKVVSHAQTGS